MNNRSYEGKLKADEVRTPQTERLQDFPFPFPSSSFKWLKHIDRG